MRSVDEGSTGLFKESSNHWITSDGLHKGLKKKEKTTWLTLPNFPQKVEGRMRGYLGIFQPGLNTLILSVLNKRDD